MNEHLQDQRLSGHLTGDAAAAAISATIIAPIITLIDR